MSPLAFAWRSLTRQPVRAVLGIAGVAIVGALLFDMLLLSRGLQVSFKELLDAVGFDVRVTATSALPGTGPLLPEGLAAAEELRGLSEIEEVIGFRFGEATMTGAPADVDVNFIGATGRAGRTWELVDGAELDFDRPGDPAEIVINPRLAGVLGASPGETVRLRGACSTGASALPPTEFRVAGIVEFLFDRRSGLTALTTLDQLERTCDLRDADSVDLLVLASTPETSSADAVEAVRRARPDLWAFSNRQFVDRLEISNFSYFRQVSFALSTVTLFFAFLLTTTLLTVSINQRLGEVAGLRALGFPRSRIVADLICESALLVGAGGLLSLPLGAVLAVLLDSILREMPGLPARLHFFVFQPRAVVLQVLLLIATGLVAALYPVYLAARLPIAATMRREMIS